MKLRNENSLLGNIYNHLFIPRDRILSAVSSDGINWKREKGIRKQYGGYHKTDMAYYTFAHKPEDFQGDWEIYYHSGTQVNDKWTTKIVRARSSDGLKWNDLPEPALCGPLSDFAQYQVRAPNVKKIGENWNLFFSAKGKDQKTRIFLATSINRIEWIFENRILLSEFECKNLIDLNYGPVTDVSDPFVIQLDDGSYRMYFSAIHGSIHRQNIASAFSLDGKKWDVEPGFRLQSGFENTFQAVCNPSIIKINEEWILYFRGANNYPLWNNIYCAKSNNCFDWTGLDLCLSYKRISINERNAVAFPFVTKTNENKYRMYYTGYWGMLFDQFIINKYRSNNPES